MSIPNSQTLSPQEAPRKKEKKEKKEKRPAVERPASAPKPKKAKAEKPEKADDGKKKRKKKDKNAPKGALSAFMYFSNAIRETVKTENPGIAFGEVRKPHCGGLVRVQGLGFLERDLEDYQDREPRYRLRGGKIIELKVGSRASYRVLA